MENRGYVSLRKTHSTGKGLKSWQKEGTRLTLMSLGA